MSKAFALSLLLCICQASASAVAPSASPVVFGRSRFTCLAQGLWRLERASANAKFDDRPTLAISQRKSIAPVNISHPSNSTIVLCSKTVCITFKEDGSESFSRDNLAIRSLTDIGVLSWKPGDVQRANLNGTYVSLDCYSDPATCYSCYTRDPACTGWEFGLEKGLLARDGWNLYDDTLSLRVVEGPEGRFPSWSNTTTLVQDLYFHAFGSEFKRALSEFTRVAGRPGLVPRAAMGVMWSRYFPYSAATFESDILEGFASHAVPLHAVYFDMDWHTEPGDPACNTWGKWDFNTTLFPDPAGFLDRLHSGDNPIGHPVAVSLNLHPQVGIDRCESRYAAFAAAVGWDTSRNATIPCALHNATWVAALFDVELGVAPLNQIDWMWTDFGGCGDPLPPSPPGGTASARAIAETAQLWATLGVFGPAAALTGKRPVVVSRQGGLGNHRVPLGFSGDTLQHELTLDYQIQTTATASNVLNSWWSHDIGGNHLPNPPSPSCPGDGDPSNYTGSELLLRWVQFGVLSPIFRTHCDHCLRTPWSFPFHAVELIDAYRFRAALLPYLYTAALKYTETGVGFVRPCYYESPNEELAYQFTHQYLVDEMLVSPISDIVGNESGAVAHKAVWLPTSAASWARWDGSELLPGGSIDNSSYSAAQVPLFVPAGTMLPLAAAGSGNDGALCPALVWTIWPGGVHGQAHVYEDDGESMEYVTPADETAAWTRAEYRANVSFVTLTVQPTEGAFPGLPESRRHSLQLLSLAGTGRSPRQVWVNGVTVAQTSPGEPGPGWSFVKDVGLSWPQRGALVVTAGLQSVNDQVVVEVAL